MADVRKAPSLAAFMASGVVDVLSRPKRWHSIDLITVASISLVGAKSGPTLPLAPAITKNSRDLTDYEFLFLLQIKIVLCAQLLLELLEPFLFAQGRCFSRVLLYHVL